MWGSSPRVRGKGLVLCACRRELGIIPAGAGKSARPHPGVQAVGIIPAGAGKSSSGSGLVASSRDHPRGCGEKLLVRTPAFKRWGSSPRVRGKVVPTGTANYIFGIIPAGAGKRRRSPTRCPSPRDHPRGCGEKAVSTSGRRPRSGSSPRVRGKVRAGDLHASADGIIPAGAGKRLRDEQQADDLQDHPRGCGEKPMASFDCSLNLGSSPRVRGKEERSHQVINDTGIIPAGAGKSCGIGRPGRGNRDHPRGCGEKAR